MPSCRALTRLLAMLLSAALAACNPPADMRDRVAVISGPRSVTLPVARLSGRPVVELAFARPDGSERRALVWVNMGAPAPVLSKALYRELGLDRGHDLAVRIGGFAVTVAADAVTDGPGELDGQDLFALLFAPRNVEAVLPAGVLRRFRITLDPLAGTLTLARPDASIPAGTPVPVRVDAATGLATVEAEVAGAPAALVLDAGAPYTWLRGRVVAAWLRAHPDWYRADGAVGRSNLAMADLGLERAGTVVRLPELRLGGLALTGVGALGTGPLLGHASDAVLGEAFWDAWQRAAPGPVAGWLGANALGDFRLTIDYAAGLSYWQRQRSADPHDLDGVGLTLVRNGDGYAVGAVAEQHGKPLVTGVEPGDRLVGVDGTPVRGAAPDAVTAALGGPAGRVRRLELERQGRLLEVEATAVPF